MALTPSPARRLTVPRRDASPRGFIPGALPLRWPDKEPGAILDYSLDVSNLLDSTDALSSVTASVSPSVPGGLVIDSTAITGNVATAWLGDGVAGVEYEVTFALSSVAGRYIPVTIILRVASLTNI